MSGPSPYLLACAGLAIGAALIAAGVALAAGVPGLLIILGVLVAGASALLIDTDPQRPGRRPKGRT